jgi:glucosamine--fructose-6-phosphate aminotransferase (isomerizing)
LTGIGIDGDSNKDPVILFKEVGKVSALRKHIAEGFRTAYPEEMANAGTTLNDATAAAKGPKIDMSKTFLSQTSMAHTRWATHGVPSVLNCHPHVSGTQTDFALVHSEWA